MLRSHFLVAAGSLFALLCLLCDRVIGAEPLGVRSAASAAIVVDSTKVIRDELPATLFGFNVQHHFFQNDLWREDRRAVEEGVVEALQCFPGAIYRFPGGLVANRFWWEQTVGPPAERGVQKAVNSDPARRVLFGVEEYIQFVKSVGGQPWYVLNLVGWDANSMFRELSGQTVAQSNAELAKVLKAGLGGLNVPRYYQLGNELDRADYQWPHDKYIARARNSMDAIRAVDPDARFVAFLRDYDWKYRGAASDRGVSRYQDFIAEVLKGLPEVNDFSMHFYYDDPGMLEKFKQIPWRLNQFQRAIDVSSAERSGQAPNVWITEHARGGNYAAGKLMQRARFTSNLSAAISTGDFLIGLAQMPEVKGAVWHGLNAGPWQLFDATTQYNDLRPRPVYWGLRVLRAVDLPVVLQTRTASPNLSKYAGGYDVRAVAFADESRNTLGLWAVNRASSPQSVVLVFEPWKGRSVGVEHFYLAGETGVDADDPDIMPRIELDPTVSKKDFSGSGSIKLELPPSSVSGFLIAGVDPD